MTATLTPRRRRRLERLHAQVRWRQYADDPVAFFRDCLWIPVKIQQDPRGRVPLDLYPYQIEDLERFQTERRLVVLKARQLGLTTISMAYALWMLLFRPGAVVLLVSKDQDTANNALELLDFMWRFMPAWAKAAAPTLKNDAATTHVWEFDDGMKSRIVSRPATKTVGAGETADLVIWDEAALAPHQGDTLKTLIGTIEAGGQIIVFSTARGAHNAFAKLYRGAQRGESQFTPIFHPWYVSRFTNPLAERLAGCDSGPCPACIDRTEYEAKKNQEPFTDQPWLIHSEFPETPDEAFRQSGRSRFHGLPPEEDFPEFDFRGHLEMAGPDVYRLVEDPFGPLRVRTDLLTLDGRPPRDVKVVLSVDPATGEGMDYTAMTLGWIDREGVPQRFAFWHANDVEPVEAARQANLLGRWACGQKRAAKLAVEKQGGYGDSIINELRNNLAYPNMYVHRYTGHRKRRRDMAFGFPMSWTRRPLVVDTLAKWLPPADLALEGIDPLLRQELGAFVVRDDGKVAADTGMHDDLVMSLAIWLYVLTEEVGAATAEPKGEDPPGMQTFTLDHMWNGIEEAERAAKRRRRRESRELSRRIRRHGRIL